MKTLLWPMGFEVEVLNMTDSSNATAMASVDFLNRYSPLSIAPQVFSDLEKSLAVHRAFDSQNNWTSSSVNSILICKLFDTFCMLTLL